MKLRLRERIAALRSLLVSLSRFDVKIDSVNLSMIELEKSVRKISYDIQNLQKKQIMTSGDVTFPANDDVHIPSATTRPLGEVFEELRRKAPAAFDQWRPLLDVNAETYTGYPIHSCSVSGHPVGQYFKYYCRAQLHGAVLDIGCGPQPLPSYLEDYPLEKIRGVDPISAPEDHPFEFERAVAESLPWPDETFNVALSGTSLDHVLLIDQSFTEIRRVLKSGGKFLVWIAFAPDAEDYDPYVNSIEPVDEFHMFHFSREGFERAVTEYFVIEDAVRFENEIDHFFYTLSKV